MQTTLSIPEVKNATGIGLTKLYQLINAGEIRARKLGKRTFVLQSDLEDFLNNLEYYPSKSKEA